MPFVPSSFLLLVVRPGAPSSFLFLDTYGTGRVVNQSSWSRGLAPLPESDLSQYFDRHPNQPALCLRVRLCLLTQSKWRRLSEVGFGLDLQTFISFFSAIALSSSLGFRLSKRAKTC